jgi:hypothetical protein
LLDSRAITVVVRAYHCIRAPVVRTNTLVVNIITLMEVNIAMIA